MMSFAGHLRAVRFAVAIVSVLALAVAPASATTSSVASVAASMPGNPSSGRPGKDDIHRAIVTCKNAPFYVWPDRSSAPSISGYPPAQLSDSFNVIGDGTLTYGTLTLYETTIDVVFPFGAGKHYWISAACVNAG